MNQTWLQRTVNKAAHGVIRLHLWGWPEWPQLSRLQRRGAATGAARWPTARAKLRPPARADRPCHACRAAGRARAARQPQRHRRPGSAVLRADPGRHKPHAPHAPHEPHALHAPRGRADCRCGHTRADKRVVGVPIVPQHVDRTTPQPRDHPRRRLCGWVRASRPPQDAAASTGDGRARAATSSALVPPSEWPSGSEGRATHWSRKARRSVAYI